MLTKGIGGKFGIATKFYMNLSDKEYLKEKNQGVVGRLFNTRLRPKFVKEIGRDYLNIINRLPNKGRISYQYLQP